MNVSGNINGSWESFLEKPQQAPCWESNANTPAAKDLQETLKNTRDGNFKELDQKVENYMNNDKLFFRLTEGNFYQVSPGEYKDVKIKVQVKEGTITWYFAGIGHDETTQEFRNQIFRTAALGHLLVDGACAKYYRGTNSMHVKRMHTSEKESKINHNHYRVHDNHVTPHQFRQHLEGFLKAQKAYGIENKFLTQKEVDKLVNEYTKFDEQLDAKDEQGKTLREKFHEQEEATWTVKDRVEFRENKEIEEPCEAQELIIPLNEKPIIANGNKILPKHWVNYNFDKTTLDIIAKAGSEGQRSDRAHIRQVKGSQLPELPKAYTKLGELFEKNANKAYPAVEQPKV